MTLKELLMVNKIKWALIGAGVIVTLPLLLKINHDVKVLRTLKKINKKL